MLSQTIILQKCFVFTPSLLLPSFSFLFLFTTERCIKYEIYLWSAIEKPTSEVPLAKTCACTFKLYLGLVCIYMLYVAF